MEDITAMQMQKLLQQDSTVGAILYQIEPVPVPVSCADHVLSDNPSQNLNPQQQQDLHSLLQEYEFPCSIKDNIAYGKDGATNEEIRAAAELANAAEFIDNLPQGLDTMVGEHGTQLSGGQKQRVAIARAILKDPRILLLDEATSALEAESERVVQEALDRIMINRTTVIVAHRLSTVRNVDSIAVLHRGTIVEKGPHSELVKHPEGAYSQLIRLQEMNNTSDKTAVNDQERRSSVGSQNQSQIISHRRSISRGSSGGGNNRRHSFSISYDVPAALGVLEVAPAESDIPDSEL
ncbi:hypothetical protein ACFX13_012192 [Malus domestica]|nr:ABC transporter B family member 4-like [Malus domestica]